MTDMDELRGPRAIPCHRQIHGESGGATVFCVVLADGYIVDCGSDGYAQRRSELLADAINSVDPSAFNFGKR